MRNMTLVPRAEMIRISATALALMVIVYTGAAWAAESPEINDGLYEAIAWLATDTPEDWEREYSRLANEPDFRVESPIELRRMVDHYVNVIRGGIVVAERWTESGDPIECVDLLTQPALEGGDLPLASPPPSPTVPISYAPTPDNNEGQTERAVGELNGLATAFDDHG